MGDKETKEENLDYLALDPERRVGYLAYTPGTATERSLAKASFNPADYSVETRGEMLIRKLIQNPFIVLGLTGVVVSLVRGVRATNRGDSWQANKMMWYRVGFQGFTIAAILISGYFEFHRNLKEERARKRKARE